MAMLRNTACGAALGLMLVLVSEAGLADEKGDVVKRLAYAVKAGSAKDLAQVLAAHFQGDAEFRTPADNPNNVLLISAKAAIFAEVVTTLETIDRAPRMIAVEVVVAEFIPDPKKPDAKVVSQKDLTGRLPDVQQKLEDLHKAGHLSKVRRMQLKGLENQPLRSEARANTPMVQGRTLTATGEWKPSFSYVPTGTSASATARVLGEKGIAVDLSVDDDRVGNSEVGVPLDDDKNAPLKLGEVVQTRVYAKVVLPSGSAAPVNQVRTTSKAGQAQTLVIVGVRLLDPTGE